SIATTAANDKLIIDMSSSRRFRWKYYARQVTMQVVECFGAHTQLSFVEEFAITFCVTLPSFRPFIEIFKFHSQHCRLNRVQPKVTAHDLVVVLRPVAVIAEQLDAIGEFGIVGRKHSAVTKTAEVRRGEETKTPKSNERAM